MVGHGKAGAEIPAENWVKDILLPGVFTLVLMAALVHLGLTVCDYIQHGTYGAEQGYAISAFAN